MLGKLLKDIWIRIKRTFQNKTLQTCFFGSLLLYLLCKKYFPKSVKLSDFFDMLKSNFIEEVIVKGSFLLFKTKIDEDWRATNRSLLSDENLLQILRSRKVTYSASIVNEKLLGSILALTIPSLIIILTFNYLQRGTNISKTHKKEEAVCVKFSDIGGCEKAKKGLYEIIDYLQNYSKYSAAGVRLPRGVLMYGPPGTGKTLIAKALATEAEVPFHYCSGAQFVELYVGVGARRVRELFKKARQNSPCLIFIDEIDALGFKRNSHNISGGTRELDMTLNQFLFEMDGFDKNDKIIVLAATNQHNLLDSALVRPGRFDRKINICLPNLEERFEIMKIHLRNKKNTLGNQCLLEAAKQCSGFSGAELENIINECSFKAIHEQDLTITESRFSTVLAEYFKTTNEFKT